MKMLLAVLFMMGACGPSKSSTHPHAEQSVPQRYEVRTFLGNHANGTLVVSFLSDGKRAISSGVDDTARLWNVASGTEVKKYSGAHFRFQSIAFLPNGDFALTPAPDGSVRYWNIETGKMQRQFAGNVNGLGAVALSSDGKWAAAGGQGTAIYVWDISSSSNSTAYRLDVDGPVVQLAFPLSKKGIYAVVGDGRLCEWSLNHPKPNRCTTALAEPVSHAAFSNDARRALIGGTYGSLVLWDVDRNAELRKLEGSQGDIVALNIAPSGGLALSGGADKTVRLWDLDTGRQVASVHAPGDYVSSVGFSPDENSALFGTSEGSVEFWQLK